MLRVLPCFRLPLTVVCVAVRIHRGVTISTDGHEVVQRLSPQRAVVPVVNLERSLPKTVLALVAGARFDLFA